MRESALKSGVVAPRSQRETVIASTPSAAASSLCVRPAPRRAVRRRLPTPPGGRCGHRRATELDRRPALARRDRFPHLAGPTGRQVDDLGVDLRGGERPTQPRELARLRPPQHLETLAVLARHEVVEPLVLCVAGMDADRVAMEGVPRAVLLVGDVDLRPGDGLPPERREHRRSVIPQPARQLERALRPAKLLEGRSGSRPTAGQVAGGAPLAREHGAAARGIARRLGRILRLGPRRDPETRPEHEERHRPDRLHLVGLTV